MLDLNKALDNLYLETGDKLSDVGIKQEDLSKYIQTKDKEFSDEKCRAIFLDNCDVAKRILLSSSVEELESIGVLPTEIIDYFRNYKALDEKCVIRPLLARGALYYDGVVYEMFHSKLESAIMGGGHGTLFGATRVGASFGLERLLMCINESQNNKDVLFYPQEETNNSFENQIVQDKGVKKKVKQLRLN